MKYLTAALVALVLALTTGLGIAPVHAAPAPSCDSDYAERMDAAHGLAQATFDYTGDYDLADSVFWEWANAAGQAWNDCQIGKAV